MRAHDRGDFTRHEDARFVGQDIQLPADDKDKLPIDDNLKRSYKSGHNPGLRTFKFTKGNQMMHKL